MNITKVFWNSFNFLIVFVLIVAAVLRLCDTGRLQAAQSVSRKVGNWLSFAAGFACLGYYVLLRVKCGALSGSLLWVVLGVLLIGRGVIVHFSLRLFGASSLPPRLYMIFHAVCLLVLVSFVTVNTLITVNCFAEPTHAADYLIIHGARTGSTVLNNRIDVAAEYLLAHPETIAIGSGGQGADEDQSEAEYIKERLVSLGVSGDRILLEDKSTTTHENLAMSKELMPEGASFIVVTDDYHMFRARLLAHKVFGYSPEGLSVHSSRVSLPNYIIHEYFSIFYNFFKGNL